MAEDVPYRKLSLQEYGRYVPQPEGATGSPALPRRRQAFIPKSPPSNVEYFQRSPYDGMVRKYSLEEYRVVESPEESEGAYIHGKSLPSVYPMYSMQSSYQSPTVLQAPGLRPVQEVQPFFALQAPRPMTMEKVIYQPISPIQQVQTHPAQYQNQFHNQLSHESDDIQMVQGHLQQMALQDNAQGHNHVQQQQQLQGHNHVQQQQQLQGSNWQPQTSQVVNNNQTYQQLQQPAHQQLQQHLQQSGHQQPQQPVQQQLQQPAHCNHPTGALQQVQNIQMVHPLQQLPGNQTLIYGMQSTMGGSGSGVLHSSYNPGMTPVYQTQQSNEMTESQEGNIQIRRRKTSIRAVKTPNENQSPPTHKTSSEGPIRKKRVSFEEEPPKRLRIIKVEKSQEADVEQEEDSDKDAKSKQDNENNNAANEDGYEPYVGLRRASTGTKPKKISANKPLEEKRRRNSMCPMTAYNLRGSSTVAIDNKIEQAMDLVKSHLMFAVREEVEVLKEQIAELIERNNQLEYENGILRAAASAETLAKLAQPRQQPPPSSSS